MIIIELPLFTDADTVALVFDPIDPSIVYDEAGNLETAIQYAHDGFIVVAVNDCKTYTGDVISPAELQKAISHEQQLVADCFGREVHYV